MKTLSIILLSLFVTMQVNAQDPGFHIEPDHNVLFGDSMSGPGTKLMWIPSKHTLLAGAVNGTQWDKDSIGFYSAVFGQNNKNKGSHNIIWGMDNKIGIGSRYAQVGGSSNTIGDLARYVQVRGFSNTIGKFAYYTQVGGSSNTIGADAYYAQVGGFKNKALSSYEHIMGRYADTTVLTTAAFEWEGTQQLFAIGNGESDMDRNNAITVLKNGHVGINQSKPLNPLHVKQASDPPGLSGAFRDSKLGFKLENASGNRAWSFHVNESGTLNFIYNNGYASYITSAGEYVDPNPLWDPNDKTKRVKKLESVLPKVRKLQAMIRPSDEKTKGRDTWGFDAEEVSRLFPAMTPEGHGRKGIIYDYFGILAIQAIQEQQAIIDTQQSQLSQQAIENATLQSRIEKLELLVNGLIEQE